MNLSLKELADLVIVRNQLATLVDTQWRVIKDFENTDLKKLNEVRINLDKKFVTMVLELNKPIIKHGEDKQLSLDFDKPKSKKSVSKVVRTDG